MSVLKVIKFPDKVLLTKTKEVPQITDAERQLVRDMIETMYAEEGVGLAANQVGVSLQIFVASADQVRGKELVFFNPVIIRKEGGLKEFEGCLSVTGIYEPVRRYKTVWMRAMDLSGKLVQVKATGLLARIFQHEVDHLNGKVFIDRLGLLKGSLAKMKLKLKLTRKQK